TGISTSKAVEGTARAAYELGYNVTLPIDAMTDSDLATHENSTQRIFPALGETGTTAEVIALLDAPTATAAASTDGESQAN
ncbi:isochorismatase family protein, partial [Rhizobium johnstonii]|uniref:isochorismatase family protein n=1 Tax=Rhizobium johnstonii TaxID=3019933 RepID=UPI003F9D5FCF